jgi:hypothetical protein
MKLYAVSYYILIYGRIVSVFLSNYKANKTLIIKKLPSLTSATLTPFFFMFFGLLFLKGGGGGGQKQKVLKITKSCKNTIYLQEMFVISLSSCSRYNANFKFDKSMFAIHDSPLRTHFEINEDD